MAKLKQADSVIKSVIRKHEKKPKRQISQLTIKIDRRLDTALASLSSSLGISKNRLIEDILFQSQIIKEVEENYSE